MHSSLFRATVALMATATALPPAAFAAERPSFRHVPRANGQAEDYRGSVDLRRRAQKWRGTLYFDGP
jgi:hypothetical protein